MFGLSPVKTPVVLLAICVVPLSRTYVTVAPTGGVGVNVLFAVSVPQLDVTFNVKDADVQL